MASNNVILDSELVTAAQASASYFYHAARPNGKGLSHAFAASMLAQPVMIRERDNEDAPCHIGRLVSLAIDPAGEVVATMRDAKGRTRDVFASNYDVWMYRGDFYALVLLPVYYKRAALKRAMLAAGATKDTADAIMGKMPATLDDSEDNPLTVTEGLVQQAQYLAELASDVQAWIAKHGTAKAAKTATRTTRKAVSVTFDDDDDSDREADEDVSHDDLSEALA